MDYSEWEPYYLQIAEDFGYSRYEDARAGEILAELLVSRDSEPVGPGHLRGLLSGNTVTVVGPAIKDTSVLEGVIIAADSSVPELLGASVLPDLITSDLDGDVSAILHANDLGSTVLIHAHGDNMESLKRYVPSFRGRIGGTVQTRPHPPLMNYGGFTDGDRAAFIADAMGARKIIVAGFDLENPVRKAWMDDASLEIKKRKLEWAERLLSLLDVEMV